MLTIKCAKCQAKLFKYNKIGRGKVLRCWKSRIKRLYRVEFQSNRLVCRGCGNEIGKNEVRSIKMKQDNFIYTGTKDSQ